MANVKLGKTRTNQPLEVEEDVLYADVVGIVANATESGDIQPQLYCFEIETEEDQDGRHIVSPFEKFDELFDLLTNGCLKPIYLWEYVSESDTYQNGFLVYSDDWYYRNYQLYTDVVGDTKIIYYE